MGYTYMGSPRQATEPYSPNTMGSKNGKPVLTDDQAQALANSSGLDVVQVRDHFDAFVAEHPNGKMKKKDFREMMSRRCRKKTRVKWKNMYLGYTTPTTMDTSISSSSWSFTILCRMGLPRRSWAKFLGFSILTAMAPLQRRSSRG